MEGDAATQQNAFIRFLIAVKTFFWEVWFEPLLTMLGIYDPPDRTYGRWNIPFSKMEERLHSNPDVTCSFHKTMMPNGKDFVWYQVWEDKLAMRATGREADMVFCHGTGVHSGTLASHSRRYLDAGYRLIVPDLPSHGYSTGMHVYQRYMMGYVSGVHQVIHDVARRDAEATGVRPTKENHRKTFLLGLSFGGLVAILYPLYYPASLREDKSDPNEIPVDGVIGVGPILGWSKKDVKIGPGLRLLTSFIELIGAQRMELYVPHKKVVDKDPKVYKQLIDSDMRSHRGAFRVGHLLCLRDAIIDTEKMAPQLKTPIFIQHGAQDRVVLPETSVKFLRDVSSTDVKLTIYPVCQHVVYRKAKTETEDKAGRIAVLEDNVEWMNERCPGHGHIDRGVSFSSDISDSDMKPPPMNRMASFSTYSGPGTPGSGVTPSESLPETPGADKGHGVVTDTLHSLTSQIDTAIETAATASAIPRVDQEITNRGARLSGPKVQHPIAKEDVLKGTNDNWTEKRVYREEWDLPNDLRPYDILI